MCNPGTTQAYFVLKAFNMVGAKLSPEDLKSSVEAVAMKYGYNSIEDVGPYKLGYLLHDFSRGRMISGNPDKGWRITDDGVDLQGILGGFVREAHPNFFS